MNDQITFDGADFDPLGATAALVAAPVEPSQEPDRAPNFHRASESVTAPAPSPDLTPVAAIRASVVAAHRATIAATDSVAHAMINRILGQIDTGATDHAPPEAPVTSGALTSRLELTAVRCFSPLARTDRTELTGPDIDRLTRGSIDDVFGAAYRQRIGAASRDVNASLRIGASGHVDSISDLHYAPTGSDFGGCVAEISGDPVAAARTTAEILGAYVGLHLCLADATVRSSVDSAPSAVGAHRLSVRVIEADLVPVPHLRARVTPIGPAGPGSPFDLTAHFVPTDAATVGPARGGALTAPTGRVGALGTPALLTEFHMAHLARGDQGTAFGPEFARYTGNRATRLPTGGLLLVDRVTEFAGRRGEWDSGARYRTEYDVPADAWYLADTANASVPHFVYMETSLQAALLMGYYLGPTLASDETLRLRNLGGTATVARRIDLRGKTIDQHSTLTSTTIMPGSSLQSFEYSLRADGVEFYSGSTMFGYFSDSALDNQTGLDAGRDRPSWLARENARSRCRSIDVAGRRAAGGPLCSTDALALVDRVEVVDGGGEFGQGYLHMDRPIDPGDWFFDCHFYLDPVIPGSLGVESVIQCLQEWLIDAGDHRGFAEPEFHIPEGVPFSWKYRGQFVPTDGHCELEVHIKTVTRDADSVVVVADASLWKPGLRIYELTDIAVELRDGAAR
ncbi:beta-hydroxydecanoyl-ACP dehydratase [Williamsia phyllosphaerae]|uniref:Trans-2-decenoyl-[acyl-carrier-protein] isomerase n=1 Tax=Williamsia phyllosphaerae TaxID=885042 RepID=A0ABQ1V109_9NOCA|nr:beta-hydroxydecanoyl-ACP dehydratase [Williamsia phyllosphaerae]GGF34099.1 hypothetical protein GCM10007298_32380 [Williamsia phyllosphaerae]